MLVFPRVLVACIDCITFLEKAIPGSNHAFLFASPDHVLSCHVVFPNPVDRVSERGRLVGISRSTRSRARHACWWLATGGSQDIVDLGSDRPAMRCHLLLDRHEVHATRVTHAIGLGSQRPRVLLPRLGNALHRWQRALHRSAIKFEHAVPSIPIPYKCRPGSLSREIKKREKKIGAIISCNATLARRPGVPACTPSRP